MTDIEIAKNTKLDEINKIAQRIENVNLDSQNVMQLLGLNYQEVQYCVSSNQIIKNKKIIYEVLIFILLLLAATGKLPVMIQKIADAYVKYVNN